MPQHNPNTRTQDIKNKFIPTGNIYIYRSFLFNNKFKLPKKTFGLISLDEKWVDIDNQEDLMKLNLYLKNKK
jgi:CMP-N-acetylneuraminic acid synthetase